MILFDQSVREAEYEDDVRTSGSTSLPGKLVPYRSYRWPPP